MADLPVPVFVSKTVDEIIAEMVERYQQITNKTLYPAQVEQLLISVMAYQEKLDLTAINESAKQNLVAFSTAPVLDYLGQNVGITRLPPAKAYCNILFTFQPGHGSLILPAGLRVRSQDGLVVFTTDVATAVLSSTNEVPVACTCESEGDSGNGYAEGDISVILDPQAYLTSAENTTETEGGSDEETDENLRQRIFLAFAQSATAGSRSSYRFYALSANPGIIDVFVAGPNQPDFIDAPPPGHVHIYPLMADGATTPLQVINQVYTACNAEDVRPLTDTVTVFAPEGVNYDIEVELTILTTADQQAIVDAVTAALEAYAEGRLSALGLDVTEDSITALCMVDGVYSVDVISPASDLVIDFNEFGRNQSITVTVAATTNG